MTERWQTTEDCKICYFYRSTGSEAKPECVARTITPLENKKACLDGPFFQVPITSEGLNRFVEITERRLGRESVEFPGLVLIK